MIYRLDLYLFCTRELVWIVSCLGHWRSLTEVTGLSPSSAAVHCYIDSTSTTPCLVARAIGPFLLVRYYGCGSSCLNIAQSFMIICHATLQVATIPKTLDNANRRLTPTTLRQFHLQKMFFFCQTFRSPIPFTAASTAAVVSQKVLMHLCTIYYQPPNLVLLQLQITFASV